MKRHLLGLAMAIPLSIGAAHAATMLTFDPGNSATIANQTPSFPSPFQGLSGTLYVTGTGMDINSQLNYYQAEVSVEGSGIFAGFDGLATYRGEISGQVPSATIMLVSGSLLYELQLYNTERIPNFVVGQVFTEQEAPSSSNLDGSPFGDFSYIVVEANNGGGYIATADATCTTQPCPAQYNITSNNTIIAPTPAPVATPVPEPSTWALLAGSLGLAGLFARRHGRLSA